MRFSVFSFPSLFLSLIFAFNPRARCQGDSEPAAQNLWIPDNGDGTYKNPIIHADYSDPDLIRVGDDFYMTSSSFNCVPGLPVLHSKDLINWRIIGHGLTKLLPEMEFKKPQHGKGVWAPSIRFHGGRFYIYYGDPDRGIYLVTAENPAGPWGEPRLVKEGLGFIDPCPLWDDDGSSYLVHAWAKSRSGFNSILTMNRMNAEGTAVTDSGRTVFDGRQSQPTIEGPKIYKRNGYYYIFAPAGGVKKGWQTVLRSPSVYGPYEERIVMDQGRSGINGPHQGGWVELKSGDSWFVHFQDKEAYGRVVHLQPLYWIDDWPMIGSDPNGDGKGEPVAVFSKPSPVKGDSISTPQESDEFDSSIGLQWQWQANPSPDWQSVDGSLRLNCAQSPEGFRNFWDLPNLLLQKFPAPTFTATAKAGCRFLNEGGRTGLIVMGSDYSYISVKRKGSVLAISQAICLNADKGSAESAADIAEITEEEIYLRVTVSDGGLCDFSYSQDGILFEPAGRSFMAKPGRWIGAKVGLFGVGDAPQSGHASYDWFRFGPSEK